MSRAAVSAEVRAAVERVRARVADAADAAGRRAEDVLLIGVSKTHPPALIQQVVDAGVADLGENRVQELVAKVDEVVDARWHLIGRLQRNKVKDVVGRRLLVHGVDRTSLARSLSNRAVEREVVQRILIQVNVGDDPDKGGCHLRDVRDLVAYARDLPNLAVEGLMTIPPMPPAGQDALAHARPHFAALREARDELLPDFPEVVHLSMGMSADLEAAVAEGATMVRVGTALFGPRGSGPWRKDVA
ncbi:MAG: YggS family pyridoxal phosphate-dependent enzyme [Nitriliruptoraceae bacterium]|nr:YggS family pyridoxal phosphate-dependent enzyme [Nitriliruptoraceae bacterium]